MIIKTVNISIFTLHRKMKVTDRIIKEESTCIYLNGRRIATFNCLKKDMEYFIYGYLFAEGFIRSQEDVDTVKFDDTCCFITVRAFKPLKSQMLKWSGSHGKSTSGLSYTVDRRCIFNLTKKFDRISPLYRKTGCIHTWAVASNNNIMFSSDDINRHNALYKVLGWLFKHGINTDDKILLSSGRITSDIVLALRNIKIPFVISKGAPTDLALYYGRKAGITIIGFSRGKRFNVYTWAGRIK